ncbi:MAG: ABC transporter permease [Myxococcales bacterium]|nr:ABC transporter permease [Myxococcales bacterium]
MRLFGFASRNLSRNRRRTVISLVALVVGMGALVTLRGFINGQQRVMIENLVYGQFGVLQVHRAGYMANVLASPLGLDLEDTPELRERILSVPGVVAVSPRIQFGAMLSTPDRLPPGEEREPTEEEKGKTSFFLATAIDPEAERKVAWKRMEWVGAGRMFPAPDSDEIILNGAFAKGLRIEPEAEGAPRPPLEQRSALLAADRDGALNGENVVLGGALLSVMPGDKKVGLVPLGTAQRLLRMEGRVTELAVAVEPLEDAPKVAAALAAALGPSYEVHRWDELFPFFGEITGTADFIFGVISSIFLAVALLGIVNSMLMSVLERVREIGTMLAVGMRRRQVVALFLMEGAILGAIGGAVGVSLGYLVVRWLHRVGIHLPAPGATTESIIRPFVGLDYVAAALALAVVGAALATLWPAMRASALRPVEALQHV